MSTLLGAICIICGCTGMWLLEQKRQRQQMENLTQFVGAMMEMHGEIRAHQTALPRIFQKLSQHYTGTVALFFAEVYQAIEAGVLLHESWEAAVAQHFFDVEQRRILLQLGRSLAGDEEEICKAILLVNECFNRILLEKRDKLPDKRRSFGALCFSGGALLLILLI